MRASAFTLSALLLSACASQQGEVLPTAAEPSPDELASMAAAVDEVVSIPIEEADSGRVCEFRSLPGSRIAYRHCYTPEEYAAHQEARDERVREQIQAVNRMRANQERLEQERWEEQERAVLYQLGQ